MTKAEIQQVKQRFGIIGNTEALSRAIDVAIQVAPTDLSVLITGESGVGKESLGSILLSTVVPYRKVRSIPNCSDTRKEHLPVLLVSGKDILEKLTVEPSSLMKWESCRCLHRRVCSVYLKAVNLSRSVHPKCKRRMYVLWQLPT